MKELRITECPRDAMQGIQDWIPTDEKITYLNSLLKVGFNVLDFGSFVSPKAIPQLKDTSTVLNSLDLEGTKTELLAIVANKRGAHDASSFDEIAYLGFPFSISEEFQKRNTNKSIEESLKSVEEIKSIADSCGKKVMIYISMAFGNPYEELWHPDIAVEWSLKLHQKLGIEHIALSDTIGLSNRENITQLFTEVLSEISNVEFGAHLHTTPDTWLEKVDAAFSAGCMNFDGALKGYGGCPMAMDKLTGNMPSENMIDFFQEKNMIQHIKKDMLEDSLKLCSSIFKMYH